MYYMWIEYRFLSETYLQELEQEKYHLRRRLEVAEEEYELKVSELHSDITVSHCEDGMIVMWRWHLHFHIILKKDNQGKLEFLVVWF